MTSTMLAAATAPVGAVESGAIIGLVLAWLAIGLVLYAWLAVALSMVFRKAGIDEWRAWVPVLNVFTLLELGGYPGWIALAVLVPFGGVVVWVFVVLAAHRVNAAFGYGTGMTVLAAVALPVWASVLGFGPARWLARMPGHRAPQTSAGPGGVPLTRRPRVEDTVRAPYPAGAMRPAPPLPSATPLRPAPPVAYPSWPAVPAAAVNGTPFAQGATGPHVATAPTAAFGAGQDVGATASWTSVAPVTAPPALPTAVPATPAAPEDWSRRARRDQAAAAAAAQRVAAEPPLSVVPTGWAAPETVRDGWSKPDSSPVPTVPPVVHQPRYGAWAPDEVDELPDEISAAQTIPGVGAPRSARESVSAQHALPEIPDDERTVVVVRRRAVWELVLPLGPPVAITGDCVILGRRPAPDPDFPEAQLVPIVDETRTVSKRHARLELREDGWWIVDLASTNGVLLQSDDDGGEEELEPGALHPAGDRFLLGDAEVRIQRGPGG